MAVIRNRAELDSNPFTSGITRMERGVSAFSSRVARIGATITKVLTFGGLAIGVRRILNLGAETSDLAASLSITTDTLQALQVTAIAAGGSTEALTAGISALQNRSEKAIQANNEYRKSFARLGISVDDLARLTIPELLEAVAKGLQSTGDFAAVIDVLDKRAAVKLRESLGVLASEGLGGLIRAAKEAGQVLDDEIIKKSDDIIDKLSLLARGALVQATNGFGALARAVRTYAQDVQAAFAGARGTGSISEAFKGAARFTRAARGDRRRAEAAADRAAAEKQEADEEIDRKRKTRKRLATLAAEAQSAAIKEGEQRKVIFDKIESETESQRDKALGFIERAGRSELADGVRFSSLRSIGANVLGSGKVENKQDRLAKLAEQAEKVRQASLGELKKINAKLEDENKLF